MYKNLPKHTKASVDFLQCLKFDLHNQNKEEKLTKMWNQTVPIPCNGVKIWSGKNHAQKVLFCNQAIEVCAL